MSINNIKDNTKTYTITGGASGSSVTGVPVKINNIQFYENKTNINKKNKKIRK